MPPCCSSPVTDRLQALIPTRHLLALAGKALLATAASCVIVVSAQAKAHCRCEITCTAADGTTFTRSNDPFPGYTQGLASERNRCESACNQWVGSSIQGWSEEERICGSVNCSGTSHVGDEPRKKWNNVAGAGHHRTCCPPASNGQGCQPAVCTDITSVFRLTQTGDVTKPYNLIYESSMNPCLDQAFQAYANYAATQVPNMTHLFVGYRVDRIAPDPPAIGQVDWFAARYNVGGSPGAPTISTLQASLLVGHTYRVSRGLFFNNAQDQNLPHFGDPACMLPSFTIVISVNASRAGGLREVAARAVATISVAGQPDRQMAIESAPPVKLDRKHFDRETVPFEPLPPPPDAKPPEGVQP